MIGISQSVSNMFEQTKSRLSTRFNSPPDQVSTEPKEPPRGPAFRNASGGIGNIQYNEVGVPWKDTALHGIIIFCTFVGMCCFAAVAGFQAKWSIGVSGLSAFALFFSLFLFFLSSFMLAVPLVFDKFDKMRALAMGLAVPRVQLILRVNGAFWTIILAMATTVSVFSEKGCKDSSNDPHADLGDAYTAGLTSWCRTKRAGSIFFWLSLAGWGGLLGLAFLGLYAARRKHQKEAGFVPPSSSIDEERAGLNTRPDSLHAPTAGHDEDGGMNEEGEGEERFDQQQQQQQQQRGPVEDRYHARFDVEPMRTRPSMDPYGAFSGSVPDGFQGYGMESSSQVVVGGGGGRVSVAPPAVNPFDQIRTALTSPPPRQLGLEQTQHHHHLQPMMSFPISPVGAQTSGPSPGPAPGGYPGYPAPTPVPVAQSRGPVGGYYPGQPDLSYQYAQPIQSPPYTPFPNQQQQPMYGYPDPYGRQ
ncbi:hypothetical protein [Phaffia rhodozyma]|uniref:MARVEL domain-containing protein n=1 Tax=Phaffia rhodozyma TaxID=264483 RepID=A0A0F7SFW8_PHARH|nr:hypothetical protein [Phaffia rhodozyma]